MEDIEIAIDSSPAAVPPLREQLSALAADAGLDPLFPLAVVEAVNNCILHAYGGRPGQPIRVHWRRAGNAVQVDIRDRAPLPVPAKLLTPGPPPPPLGESGKGWFIIHQCSDAVDFAREGDWNRLTLTRRPR